MFLPNECTSRLGTIKKKGGHLYRHFRTQGKRYRKRGAGKDRRGEIASRNGIENRPKEVDLKERGYVKLDIF